MKVAFAVSVLLACSIPDARAQVSLERREVINVPMEALRSLTPGMRESDVENKLGKRGNHQFSAILSNGVIRCIAYCRDAIYGEYYLVFTNGHLSAICVPPPHEMERIPYRGTWLNQSVLRDPEDRITSVREARNLIGTEFGASVKHRKEKARSYDLGLTAAYLLTRTLCAGKAQEEKRARVYAELLDKYDPFKVELGAAAEAVEERLGAPQITQALDREREMRYYGSIEYGFMGSRKLMWLAIVYDKGKVIRVFSDDFVDYAKIRELEKMKYPGDEP